MSEKPSLNFDTPKFTADELEEQLGAYEPETAQYPHDHPSIGSVRQGVHAGRMGNVAVGGCSQKHGEVALEVVSKAISPDHRTDLYGEKVLLNIIEEAQCAPELEETLRQGWLNSIEPSMRQFLDRN